MYKVANGIVPEQTQFMFKKFTNIHSHNSGSASSESYIISKMKTAKRSDSICILGTTGLKQFTDSYEAGSVNSQIPRKIKRILHSTKYMMTIKGVVIKYGTGGQKIL